MQCLLLFHNTSYNVSNSLKILFDIPSDRNQLMKVIFSHIYYLTQNIHKYISVHLKNYSHVLRVLRVKVHHTLYVESYILSGFIPSKLYSLFTKYTNKHVHVLLLVHVIISVIVLLNWAVNSIPLCVCVIVPMKVLKRQIVCTVKLG